MLVIIVARYDISKQNWVSFCDRSRKGEHGSKSSRARRLAASLCKRYRIAWDWEPLTMVLSKRLNQEIARFLKIAEAQERILNAGLEVVASSPEEYAVAMKSNISKWSKVIKAAGIRSE